MTRAKNRLVTTFLAALCLSASVIVPAQANDIVLLPDIPSDQIARDSALSYDSNTGISIVTAPTFDPFEQDNTLAGTASLRGGPNEIAIDGTHVSGGAYLDLRMIYTSASDDPYDLRGFDRAFYVSGDDVSRIRQDVRTLDCASNTTEVVYEDNYYDSYESYGYLAGLFLLLPRYRGHRGFWSGTSRYHPSIGWSDWRKRSAYSNYGSGYYSGFNTTGRGIGVRGSGSRGFDGRGNGTRRTTGRGSDGRGTGRRDEDGRAENKDTTRTKRHNGRNSVIGGSASKREYRRQRGVVTGGPLQRAPNQAERSRNNERSAVERANNRSTQTNRASRTSRVGRTDRGRGSNPTVGRTQKPLTTRRANPAGSAPRTVARSAPPATVNSAPTPRTQPKAKPRSQPRAERSSKRSSSSSSSSKSRASRNLNREVDRSFRKTSRTRGKQLDFFPRLGGYTQLSSNVITNYRCVREESVTLHIPQERLDAARFDGMTLIVVDNADRDVPIYLPPNYIEGFRQAAGGSVYSNSSTPVVTPPAIYQDPYYSQPSYHQGYPQN